eukprot:365542-Chlamydomonas_euryale.AAC.25
MHDTTCLHAAASPSCLSCKQFDARSVMNGCILTPVQDERYTFKLIKNKFVAICRAKGADKQAIGAASASEIMHCCGMEYVLLSWIKTFLENVIT